MTDISSDMQLQLNQALQQLVKSTPDSEMARKAIEVVIKHLNANVVQITPTQLAEFKSLLLPKDNLTGYLHNGERYLIQLAASQPKQLAFFSVKQVPQETRVPLSEQLSSKLLKLPSQQIASLLAVTQTANSANQTSQLTQPIFQATVAAKDAHRLVLNVSSVEPPVKLALPVSKPIPFEVGDTVTVTITARGKNWQIDISPRILSRPETTKNDVFIPSSPLTRPLQTNHALNSQLGNTAQNQNQQTLSPSLPASPSPANDPSKPVESQKLIVSSDLTLPIVKALMSQGNNTDSIELAITLKQLVASLKQTSTAETEQLNKQLAQLNPDKISLNISSDGKVSLKLQHSLPSATLPIAAENLAAVKDFTSTKSINKRQIEHLFSPNSDIKINKESTPNRLTNQITELTPAIAASSTNTSNNLNSPDTSLINKPLNLSPLNILSQLISSGKAIKQAVLNTEKSTINQEIQTPIKSNENAKASIFSEANINQQSLLKSGLSEQSVQDKNQQIALLQNLLRLSQPKADLPSQVLTNLDKIVLEALQNKTFTEPSAIDWLKQATKELKASLPQGNDFDAANIKQVLSSPALGLSPVQLISPPATSGLLSGLLTFIQVSLAARLNRNQPNLSDKISQLLPTLLSDNNQSTSANSSSPVANKGLLELNQFEQKHQLLKEIGKLLADHQSNKVNNAERLLQGQDSFYYNLPTAFGGEFNNIELLIKREHEKQQSANQENNENKNWQLTMKLSVGEIGELLTKAKLKNAQVEIDFYASNTEVLHTVMNFLPLLKKRLVNLGIDLHKSQCQLGKIPDTLSQRPYHIFSAKA